MGARGARAPTRDPRPTPRTHQGEGMSSQRGFWLVGSSGNLPSGKPAQVVFADTKPAGYGYTHFLGDFTLSQKKQFEAALAQALVSLPTGISIPSQLNVPYFGQVSMPGPGGI